MTTEMQFSTEQRLLTLTDNKSFALSPVWWRTQAVAGINSIDPKLRRCWLLVKNFTFSAFFSQFHRSVFGVSLNYEYMVSFTVNLIPISLYKALDLVLILKLGHALTPLLLSVALAESCRFYSLIVLEYICINLNTNVKNPKIF
jgi:hypothetical protein